eukprot:TRINITY_DN14053_c0_g1_i1.p1 TRINITY_DN14053_c0_g1~~TRINITY_DN14053_c0_g1_i1.p1  ORF type:complete len:290 (-),score=64.93 TRINITY_DN14053_c0_g1_i1:303-1148(-)
MKLKNYEDEIDVIPQEEKSQSRKNSLYSDILPQEEKAKSRKNSVVALFSDSLPQEEKVRSRNNSLASIYSDLLPQVRSRQNSLAIIFPEVQDVPEELVNSSDDDEPETDLVEGNEDPDHHYPCNMEFHGPEEVHRSQKEYNWKVVDPFADNNWTSWAAIGESVPHPKYEIKWKNCADISHAWTGIMYFTPGQIEPLHHHSAPMIYYILKGQPIVTLNGIKNRTSSWQCVSIPAYCPHSCYNDSDEEVVVAWTYLTNQVSAKPRPGKDFEWKFLQEMDSEEK